MIDLPSENIEIKYTLFGITSQVLVIFEDNSYLSYNLSDWDNPILKDHISKDINKIYYDIVLRERYKKIKRILSGKTN